MSETIQVSFDPSILPAWARREPAVVALAERNLAFRCDVCRADSPARRHNLIRDARTWASQEGQ